ncbi:MAG: hypothetical protein GC184_03530 [Rhizobiales bacterium]|nr:hypothetical protein [Hyphomicrobiales bacterium]
MNALSSMKASPNEAVVANRILTTPHSAAVLRSWGILGNKSRLPQAQVEVVSGTEAISRQLLTDNRLRLIVLPPSLLADGRLQHFLSQEKDYPSRPWLHLLLLTPDAHLPQLPALRQFRSWSPLPQTCDADTALSMFEEALFRSDESYRQEQRSKNLVAETEDLLARTQNVLGVLRHYEKAPADKNLMAAASAMSNEAAMLIGSAIPKEESDSATTESAAALCEWAGRMIKLQSRRDRLFPESLLSDPAWDMLLDLTQAHLSGKQVSVSSLCIASRVPATTALRRIGDLVDSGLACRVRDQCDGRRVFVCITEEGLKRMQLVRQAYQTDLGC